MWTYEIDEAGQRVVIIGSRLCGVVHCSFDALRGDWRSSFALLRLQQAQWVEVIGVARDELIDRGIIAQ